MHPNPYLYHMHQNQIAYLRDKAEPAVEEEKIEYRVWGLMENGAPFKFRALLYPSRAEAFVQRIGEHYSHSFLKGVTMTTIRMADVVQLSIEPVERNRDEP